MWKQFVYATTSHLKLGTVDDKLLGFLTTEKITNSGLGDGPDRTQSLTVSQIFCNTKKVVERLRSRGFRSRFEGCDSEKSPQNVPEFSGTL